MYLALGQRQTFPWGIFLFLNTIIQSLADRRMPEDAYVSLMAHYENMPMQYTAIFHGCKIDNFSDEKNVIFFLFLLKTDCGYMLEPPH